MTSFASDFFDKFRPTIKEHVQAIEEAADLNTLQLILPKLQSLHQQYNEVHTFLPAYDAQSYEKSIREAQELYTAKVTQLSKKTKFSFKSRKKGSTEKIATDAEAPAPSVEPKAAASTSYNEATYTNICDRLQILKAEMTAMHLSQIHRAILIIPPIDGSILLDGCSDSLILCACRQLRLHHAKNVHIWCRTQSGPIIEDCDGMYFADLTATACFDWPMWAPIKDHDALPANKWNAVEDFHWIKKQASPHYKVIDASTATLYFDTLSTFVTAEKEKAESSKDGETWHALGTVLADATQKLIV